MSDTTSQRKTSFKEVDGEVVLWNYDKISNVRKVAKTAAIEDLSSEILRLVAQDPAAKAAVQYLAPHGEVFVVGGAPRDVVLGKNPKDIDLMARVDGKVIEDTLGRIKGGRVFLTGKQFPVYRFKYKGSEVEIALPRTEEKIPGGGNKDWKVIFGPDISVEEDLRRRDFTANAIAVNAVTGEVVDPFGGIDDIANKRVRTVTNTSFRDDSSRILRALTQMAKNGLVPDDVTKFQMAEYAEHLNKAAPELIQKELDKIMAAGNPHLAIRLAYETGILKQFMPEVYDAFGFDQKNPYHQLELGDHLLEVLEGVLDSDDPDLRLAALLHDIGKPASQWIDEKGVGHYYRKQMPDGSFVGDQHETVGGQMARERMRALRYPKERIENVGFLIDNHMFPAFKNMKGARKFLQMAGNYENALRLLALRRADQGGKGNEGPGAQDIDLMYSLLEQVEAEGNAFTLKDLAVNGRDIIDATGATGPEVGRKLNELLERVIEDPSLNNRQTLLDMARTAAFEESLGEQLVIQDTYDLEEILNQLPAVVDSGYDTGSQTLSWLFDHENNKLIIGRGSHGSIMKAYNKSIGFDDGDAGSGDGYFYDADMLGMPIYGRGLLDVKEGIAIIEHYDEWDIYLNYPGRCREGAYFLANLLKPYIDVKIVRWDGLSEEVIHKNAAILKTSLGDTPIAKLFNKFKQNPKFVFPIGDEDPWEFTTREDGPLPFIYDHENDKFLVGFDVHGNLMRAYDEQRGRPESRLWDDSDDPETINADNYFFEIVNHGEELYGRGYIQWDGFRYLIYPYENVQIYKSFPGLSANAGVKIKEQLARMGIPNLTRKMAREVDVAQQIYEYVQSHGGGSFNPRMDYAPDQSKGYFVAWENYEQTLPASEFTTETIETFIKKHQKTLNEPNNLFGVWNDKGTIFMDVSRYFTDLDEAMMFGVINNQYSLYDSIHDKVVEIDSDRTKQKKMAAQGTWNFLPYMQEIGEAYAAARDQSSDPRVQAYWQALADDSVRRAAQLDQKHNIKTVQFEPYENAEQQDYDVRMFNQFLVSDQNSEHPLWSVEENVAFRKVHDLMGHIPSAGDFSWEGENRACGEHFKILGPEARIALFVECIMQTAAVNVYRQFLDQKCFIPDNFDPQAGYIPRGQAQPYREDAGAIYRGRGLQAAFKASSFDAALQKEAAWADVAAKAKRLKDEGRVHIIRNAIDTVVASVRGDHGTYQTELYRQDPNSGAISSWDCECPWGTTWAWQRTRGWKYLEGRLCAHAMATYWQSQATPLEDPETTAPAPPTLPPPGMSPPTPAVPAPVIPESQLVPPGTTIPGTIVIPGTFSKRMAQLLEDYMFFQNLKE